MTTQTTNTHQTADCEQPGSVAQSAATATGQAGYTSSIPQYNGAGMSPLSRAIWLLASYGMEREERERAAAASGVAG